MPRAVFDSTFLLLLTDDTAAAPSAPAGVRDTARDRLAFLLETLEDARFDIVVPAPVLTELLASARTDPAATLSVMNRLARIRVEPFGQRAAIECGEMLRRTGRGSGPKAKVKYDHLIVAIAKVVGAEAVYSDDGDVSSLCGREGIRCAGVWRVPARPVDPQHPLPFKGDA